MTEREPTQRYHVVVRISGGGWRAWVESPGGLPGVHARDLSEVEPKIRRMIWGFTGDTGENSELDVDLRLPAAIQIRLNLAEQLCDDAQAEVEKVITDLLEAGVSVVDIGQILRRRGRTPPRPLTVTIREIVESGLANHPDAWGIRWDDHGRFLTITCRTCLEHLRSTYLETDTDLDSEAVLLYDPAPFHCNECTKKEAIARTEAGAQARAA